MTIKRFQDFPNRNEDTILDECGWPEAQPSDNDAHYYSVSDIVEFLFVDEDEIEWIVNPDSFSMRTEGAFKKNLLVTEIESKNLVVFVINKGKKDYVFYGIYKLSYPYEDIGGAGKVINIYTPLKYYLEREDYVL